MKDEMDEKHKLNMRREDMDADADRWRGAEFCQSFRRLQELLKAMFK